MLCWGDSRWSVRRLLSHINNLPRESAYVRSLLGDRADWDQRVEILASIFDAIRSLNFNYVASHSERMPDEPDPYPRPGIEESEPETVTIADLANFLKG